MKTALIRATLLGAILACAQPAIAQQRPAYLHVWGTATDTARSIPGDTTRPTRRGVVLATIDLSNGRVAGVIVADTAGRSAHHTEHALAADRMFFANDFGPGRTYRFDFSKPGEPRLLGNFTTAGPFSHPHSFVQLPNGNMLVTYQVQTNDQPPGGLAEVRRDGTAVRWARAAAAGVDSVAIQPYSLEVVPALDRVVTTSTSMVSDVGMHVQIWRLSDLTLLHTLPMPAAPKEHIHGSTKAAHDNAHHLYPGEPRLLADGRTVMLGTFTCGLYVVTGIDTNTPALKYAQSFPGENCAVPVRTGKWWVQTVPEENALVVLDVTNPLAPREANRMRFGAVKPHWLAANDAGTLLVMNSGSWRDPKLYLVRMNLETGALTADASLPVIDLARVRVQGLGVVRIEPHGSVFQ
jgi:hypothetical protein